ncbi:DUF4190 domain-containing protein [Streptomyces parvulus]|uniref:DUF4190 domain-containing protein n=1 Tax=Streptomyces parvulus TaxID=146923 RepID=A0A369UU98_9ACTN|nr:DUF4190 domain-containing protein [Streptomyces parvulus]RDD84334.1 DUF4190 domain-containing protein [Streptomyces parvulus]
MTDFSNRANISGARTNGLAVAGLVCGIVGIVFLSIVLGPLAVVFGSVALRQAGAKGGGGMAKAAIALGIFDVVLFVVLMIVAASSGGFSWYVGG